MRAPSLLAGILGLFALPSCGGSAPARPGPVTPATDAPAASAPAPSASADPPPAPAAHLPGACADASSPVCGLPNDFIDRLCEKPMQDVALSLFAKETPFTRLYLRGKLDELQFDEEVLALRFHAQPRNGMVVGSGNGSYDVLRWDGTCSRGVEAEMIARARPPRPKSAHVQWHRIGVRLQDTLIAASEPVKRAHAKRGKECKGAMSGDVSKACENADQALVDAIVDYVRTEGGLPAPETLP
jgi:hypothetical protein